MNEQNYQMILEFLHQYGGKQYKRQDKCTSDDERAFMVSGYKSGQEARAGFTRIADSVAEEHGLLYDRITPWQNSGVFVRYFWCQLKQADYKERQISLSLFAESAEGQLRYRVSVELATDKATASDVSAYRKLLDKPLDPELVYVSGGNNESEFRVLDSHDNTAVKSLGLKKVQVSYIVPQSQFANDEELEEKISCATETLLGYYRFILSDSQNADNQPSLWWPSEEDYSPGLSAAQWLSLLQNQKIFTERARSAIAAMFDIGGQASCIQLEERYGKPCDHYRAVLGVHLPERIIHETNCPKPPDKKLWPVVFVGRGAESDERGAFIWKIRPELYDALEEFGIERFLSSDNPTASVDKKAWLLSWNPSGWNWMDYHEAALRTHSGGPYEDSWTCASTKVQPGDRVFLTVLGIGEKNGIIASGFATGGSYIDEHWDLEKAAQGKKAKRIDVRFDWISDYNTDPYLKQSTLKELFPEQEWSPMGSGISIKDQYVEQLEEEWAKITQGGGEDELSVKDTVAQIKEYIAAKGFRYENGLIENFYLSLKAKPFVILAGTSGTGKTRLVKLFAEAIGATSENGRYKMVSVRPDWSDSTDLFGHVDLNGRFVPGAILDFVKRAEEDIDNPYILCLDEMNLARVEYYLSDVLSVIETRDFDLQGRIVTDPLIPADYYGSDAGAAEKYGEVRLPENLYIVGTVNMDETTFPFSKKVLDRANTIEFSHVDLSVTNIPEDDVPPMALANGFLKTKYLLLKQCLGERDVVEQYCAELQEINKILQPANAHVGYRVRDEIVFYLLNNHEHGLLSDDEAMDNEIMQKILPRIQGSSASVKEMLCELFKRCASDFEGYGTGSEDLSKKMFAAADKPECKYKNSARKIAFMVRRFEEDGFTSYWL